jgi:hypothetical protein
MTKPLQNKAFNAKMKRGERCANTNPPLEQSDLVIGDQTMSRWEHYRDSERESNIEHSQNWKSIGSLAAALVAKAVAK